MKIWMQLSSVDEPDPLGVGVATVGLKVPPEDLSLPLDVFVERYVKPAWAKVVQEHEAMANEGK